VPPACLSLSRRDWRDLDADAFSYTGLAHDTHDSADVRTFVSLKLLLHPNNSLFFQDYVGNPVPERQNQSGFK